MDNVTPLRIGTPTHVVLPDGGKQRGVGYNLTPADYLKENESWLKGMGFEGLVEDDCVVRKCDEFIVLDFFTKKGMWRHLRRDMARLRRESGIDHVLRPLQPYADTLMRIDTTLLLRAHTCDRRMKEIERTFDRMVKDETTTSDMLYDLHCEYMVVSGTLKATRIGSKR